MVLGWGAQQKGEARNGSLELLAPPAPHPLGGQGLELVGGPSRRDNEAAVESPSCGIQGPSRSQNTWGPGMWHLDRAWELLVHLALHTSSSAARVCSPQFCEPL